MTLKSTDGYITLRQGHTRPIDFTLERDGVVEDVSGAAPKVVRGRLTTATATKFEIALTFTGGGTDGVVRMQPIAATFDTADAMYELEFKLTMADGVEFVPDLFFIFIEEALTGGPP